MTTATIESQTEPRPKTATRDMRRAAAEKTVEELIRHGHLTESERQDSIETLAKTGERHLDGYQIAKSLDDRYGWDCNLEMAEDLDTFAQYLDDEIKKAEKEWFERVKPQPPYPNGSRVAFGRSSTGTIAEVYEYGVAKYAIKVDGDPEADTESRRRSIVNFEDVRAA